MNRYHFVFTQHAKKRCIQRNINTSLLKRQLQAFAYDSNKNKKIRWNIPETNLYVVFFDKNKKRIIITVSFRYINKIVSDDGKN